MMLDPKGIYIHLSLLDIDHINLKFPVSATQEKERWRKLLKENLNQKCRTLRTSAK